MNFIDNLLYLLCFSSGYLSIFYILEYNPYFAYTMKLNRNLLSGIHCYSNIILSSLYLGNLSQWITFEMVIINSISYFILDSIWIYYNYKVNNNFEKWFLLHHLISLYFLIETLKIKNLFYLILLFVGEFSNIFNYPIYHLINTKQYWITLSETRKNHLILVNYHNLVRDLKLYQLVNNFLIRILFFSIIFFFYREQIHNTYLIYTLSIIYILGIYWFVNQLMAYRKENKRPLEMNKFE